MWPESPITTGVATRLTHYRRHGSHGLHLSLPCHITPLISFSSFFLRLRVSLMCSIPHVKPALLMLSHLSLCMTHSVSSHSNSASLHLKSVSLRCRLAGEERREESGLRRESWTSASCMPHMCRSPPSNHGSSSHRVSTSSTSSSCNDPAPRLKQSDTVGLRPKQGIAHRRRRRSDLARPIGSWRSLARACVCVSAPLHLVCHSGCACEIRSTAHSLIKSLLCLLLPATEGT